MPAAPSPGVRRALGMCGGNRRGPLHQAGSLPQDWRGAARGGPPCGAGRSRQMYCSGCCGTWSEFVLVGRVSMASGLLEWVGADILLRFILLLGSLFCVRLFSDRSAALFASTPPDLNFPRIFAFSPFCVFSCLSTPTLL
jgi:hypothetical protein